MMEQIYQKNILEIRKKIMMMIPISLQRNQNHLIIKSISKFIETSYKINGNK